MLVHVWSEFGRRGAENASGGTDHGGGGIGFLIGSKLTGKQIGSHPGHHRRARRAGEPQAKRGLPRGLLGDPRAVARHRRQRRDPERRRVQAADPAQVRRAALAALVAVAGLAVVPAQAAAGPIKITRVQVSARSSSSRSRAARSTSGPAIVQFVNFGEDPHDMRIRRVGGTHTYRTPLVQPGRLLRPRAEAAARAATGSGAASRTTRRSDEGDAHRARLVEAVPASAHPPWGAPGTLSAAGLIRRRDGVPVRTEPSRRYGRIRTWPATSRISPTKPSWRWSHARRSSRSLSCTTATTASPTGSHCACCATRRSRRTPCRRRSSPSGARPGASSPSGRRRAPGS